MRAGIEAGGTKFVCGIGTGPSDLHDIVTFPTTTPDETLARVEDFLRHHAEGEPACCGTRIDAIGVASFGPVDLRRESSSFGAITSTPKPGWEGTRLYERLTATFGLPVGFDTDVNGAALGEFRWGAARGTATSAYVTVGTGVGGGAIVAGRPLHGLVHPEMGHLLVRRHPDDAFEGSCPFHGDCAEGLAAGPAIQGRWGVHGELLGPLLDEAVPLLGFYVAQVVTAIMYVLSAERIALGGGVLKMNGLLEEVRKQTMTLLAGALDASGLSDDLTDYLVRPELGDGAGLLGALALAEDAASSRARPLVTP